MPPKDLEVLAKAMGVPDVVSKMSDKSTPPMTPTMVGRRSVLGDMTYGPGNRPYWDMKEGRAQSRYPNLIRALSKEPDTSRRRQLFDSHRLRTGSASGASRMRLKQRRAKASSQ